MPNLDLPDTIPYGDLKGVMLKMPPLSVFPPMPEEDREGLFFGTSEYLKYAQGAVAEDTSHITLLFGIHPLGGAHRRVVDSVLQGWEPGMVEIDHVGHFPSRIEGEDYNTIVAHIKVQPWLAEANARLGVLDHSTNYPDYKPHLTLAYIKGTEDLDRWIAVLDNEYRGKTLKPIGLNYGD